MQEILKKHATKLRFALIGGLNTAIDFGVLFIATYLLNIPKIPSNVISTTVAFVFSFFANKKFTFKSKSKNVIREVVLFTTVTLFGLWVIQSIIIAALTPAIVGFGILEAAALFISKLIATVASLAWNYLLYSRVVFKNDQADQDSVA